jgi:hypothetical protein
VVGDLGGRGLDVDVAAFSPAAAASRFLDAVLSL